MVKKTALYMVCVGLLVLSTAPGFAQPRLSLTLPTYFTPGFASAMALDHVLAEFQKANPGVEVKHTFVPFAELIPTIMRQAMVGSLPDIVFADNPDVRHLAKAGVFLDLTPMVRAWGQWDDFAVGSRYATTWRDKVYALHFSTNNLALYYNRDHFSRAGIAAPPTTWEELLEVSRTLTERLGGRGVFPIGFSAIDSEEGTWQLLPFIWSNGGSILELHKPAAVEALRLWVTLVERRYAPRDVLTWPQTAGVMVEFRAGRLAMMINGPWVLPDLRKSEVKYGIAPLPVPRRGAARAVAMGGEALGLAPNISIAKLDAAWKLLRFLTAPENMTEFTVRAGRVPTRHSVIPLAASRDPELAVFAMQARRGLPRPIMGGDERYTTISAITRRYMQQAVGGMLPPEAAFERASREIRALFPTEAEYQAAVAAAAQVLTEAVATR